MADLIDRQQAIDVLEERLQANGYSNVALVSELNRSIGYLMRLPSVQPEQRWIPCGERLPEVGKGVLLTTTFPTVIIGWLKSDGKWMIYENDGNSFQDYIIAWMPLPEPYQGGKRDE